MGQYTEDDLKKVTGGIDPRFVEESIPEPSYKDEDELSFEQLQTVRGDFPSYGSAVDYARENSEAFRRAAVDRAIAEMEKGEEVPTISTGGMRR